jgi:hypothetical protein
MKKNGNWNCTKVLYLRIESASALNFFGSVVGRQSFDTAPEDPTSYLDADPDLATDPTSVADPWHFGVDPDPRIHASD